MPLSQIHNERAAIANKTRESTWCLLSYCHFLFRFPSFIYFTGLLSLAACMRYSGVIFKEHDTKWIPMTWKFISIDNRIQYWVCRSKNKSEWTFYEIVRYESLYYWNDNLISRYCEDIIIFVFTFINKMKLLFVIIFLQ